MAYTVGEMAKRLGVPASTLRYYDKEGLLPHIQRQGAGIRRFDEQTVEALRVIECLKKSGMEIKDIRQFMVWCGEGASTYQQRLELFQRRRAEVEHAKAEGVRLLELAAPLEFMGDRRWPPEARTLPPLFRRDCRRRSGRFTSFPTAERGADRAD